LEASIECLDALTPFDEGRWVVIECTIPRTEADTSSDADAFGVKNEDREFLVSPLAHPPGGHEGAHDVLGKLFLLAWATPVVRICGFFHPSSLPLLVGEDASSLEDARQSVTGRHMANPANPTAA